MMSGYEEGAYVTAEMVAEYYAAIDAAAGAAGAAEGAGALSGAGAAAAAGAGLTATQMAALEAASAEGLAGSGELGLLGTGAGGAGGSGGTASGASIVDALDKAGAANAAEGYFGGNSAGGLLSDPSSVLASDGTGNAFTSPYEQMKYKGLNALNKVGGAYNKLPAPVQGLLASSLMPKPEPQMQAAQRPAPHPQSAPPPSTPTYGGQGYQAHGFGSQYGQGQEGLLGMSPEQIAMLKRLLAQQGGSYA